MPSSAKATIEDTPPTAPMVKTNLDEGISNAGQATPRYFAENEVKALLVYFVIHPLVGYFIMPYVGDTSQYRRLPRFDKLELKQVDSLDPAPRIVDVLEYFEANGGLNWTDAGNNTRYTVHTVDEWAVAELALIGGGNQTFIGALASLANSSLDSNVSSPVKPSTPSTTSNKIKRDSRAKKIDGGISIGNAFRYADYRCFNSGQWAATGAFTDFVDQACHAVMSSDHQNRVITWHSQGYHQPDHNIAAWFVQQSGKGYLSSRTCQQLFYGFQNGGLPTGQGPLCGGTGNLGAKDGPGMTQGGYVRWHDGSYSSSPKGLYAGELRIDPNTCHDNGKPCSSTKNVATMPNI
ncbi:MAG: hypothetical protein Q9227_003366 [Pyrenula ochraceoflavens]